MPLRVTTPPEIAAAARARPRTRADRAQPVPAAAAARAACPRRPSATGAGGRSRARRVPGLRRTLAPRSPGAEGEYGFDMVKNLDDPMAIVEISWLSAEEGGRCNGPPQVSGGPDYGVYIPACRLPFEEDEAALDAGEGDYVSILLQKVSGEGLSWVAKADFLEPDRVRPHLRIGRFMAVVEGARLVARARIREVFPEGRIRRVQMARRSGNRGSERSGEEILGGVDRRTCGPGRGGMDFCAGRGKAQRPTRVALRLGRRASSRGHAASSRL